VRLRPPAVVRLEGALAHGQTPSLEITAWDDPTEPNADRGKRATRDTRALAKEVIYTVRIASCAGQTALPSAGEDGESHVANGETAVLRRANGRHADTYCRTGTGAVRFADRAVAVVGRPAGSATANKGRLRRGPAGIVVHACMHSLCRSLWTGRICAGIRASRDEIAISGVTHSGRQP
jgi:hypothetical protein